MKIMLIQPDNPYMLTRDYWLMEPLNLEMLAAHLTHHEVFIYDMRMDPRFMHNLKAFSIIRLIC